jgi:hypothetical protein
MEEFPLADGAWAERWQKLVSSVQAAHQRASYSLQCPYYAFEAYTQSLPPGSSALHASRRSCAMMHSPSNALSGWTTAVFVLLCGFASVSQADVRFTEPSAGANLTAGQIDVRWEDSGISPPISELTQYTLSLMVGGNDDADMVCLTFLLACLS